MARRKTTVYLDEALLTAVKVAAARSHRREYEVVEEALRRHLGLQEVVEQVWAGLGSSALSEQDSLALAYAELKAARSEQDKGQAA